MITQNDMAVKLAALEFWDEQLSPHWAGTWKSYFESNTPPSLSVTKSNHSGFDSIAVVYNTLTDSRVDTRQTVVHFKIAFSKYGIPGRGVVIVSRYQLCSPLIHSTFDGNDLTCPHE